MVMIARDYPSNELLFMVASELLELNLIQKLRIGINLTLVGMEAYSLSENLLEERIFTAAYQRDMIGSLVKEMQKVK